MLRLRPRVTCKEHEIGANNIGSGPHNTRTGKENATAMCFLDRGARPRRFGDVRRRVAPAHEGCFIPEMHRPRHETCRGASVRVATGGLAVRSSRR